MRDGLAQPAGLAALEEWISSAPIADAGNFSIVHHDDYLMARLSRRWFGVQQDLWSNEWTRLHRATYAIRREVFLKLGGLPPYGQFGVPLLSAKLAEEGYTVERVPGADVLHLDDDTIYDHHFDTIDFVVGECEARAASDPPFFEKYFGHREVFTNRLLAETSVLRPIFLACFRALLMRVLNGENLGNLPRVTVFLVGKSQLSPELRVSYSEAITKLDEALLLAPGVPNELRYRWFVRAHRRVVETQLLKWNRDKKRQTNEGLGFGQYQVTDLSPAFAAGFHGLEFFNEQPFRWTDRFLHIRFQKTHEIKTVSICCGEILQDPSINVLLVTCGSSLVPLESVSNGPSQTIEISVPPNLHRQARENGLSILFSPQPTAKGEHRYLGVPVFSITIS